MSAWEVDILPPERDGRMKYGCLFCRTGKEKSLAAEIESEFPEVQAIFAEKLRRRRVGPGKIEEAVPLFPGYLFFRTGANIDARQFVRRQDVFRLLRDSEGIWALRGEDLHIARYLFTQNGVVGFSKAYYEGDRICVTDGLLKAYAGQIIRVNRRSQTAQIALEVGGNRVTVWLGFELIEREEE